VSNSIGPKQQRIINAGWWCSSAFDVTGNTGRLWHRSAVVILAVSVSVSCCTQPLFYHSVSGDASGLPERQKLTNNRPFVKRFTLCYRTVVCPVYV